MNVKFSEIEIYREPTVEWIKAIIKATIWNIQKKTIRIARRKKNSKGHR